MLRRVRSAGLAHRIPLGSDGPGRTVVAADVLADLTARAAAAPSGVAEVTDVRVAATDTGAVDLSVELTGQLDWSQPLAQVAEAVRHAIEAQLWTIVGVRVGRVEVVISDLRGLSRALMDKNLRTARDTSGTAGV